jgi:hypothetical protein
MIQVTHPGLPDLTAFQLENMAILLYGPYAGGHKPTEQYYTPICEDGVVKGNACIGGSWVWKVNTWGEPLG